jgi:hypothetical protein
VAVRELSGTVPAKSGSEGKPRKPGEGVQADLRIGINEFRFFCTETGLGPAVGIYNMTTDEWLAERQWATNEKDAREKAEIRAKELWRSIGKVEGDCPGLKWKPTSR